MDVILTTNSPGEVSAWVRPMVKAVKAEWPESKITVFIPPCTFASGREVPVVEKFPEVDLVAGPMPTLRYLLLHQKPHGFQTGKEGFVLFLGGDLGYATRLGKRLNYPVYAYSERDAGHPEAIKRFFVPSKRVAGRLSSKGISQAKIQVVGDLMLDAVKPEYDKAEMRKLLKIEDQHLVLNIFPGSRPYEVAESLPLFLQAALLLKQRKDTVKPLVTLAPFISYENIHKYMARFPKEDWDLEETSEENLIRLILREQEFLLYTGSSYNTMLVTDLAWSLPGTNNVELAAMEVPTLVILPLNWPELIPLPGLVGLIGQIPGLGGFLKRRFVIPKLVEKFPQVSPVNRAQGQFIIPELVGMLTSEMVAERGQFIIERELIEIQKKLKEQKKEEKASQRILTQIRADLLAYQ